MIPTFYYGTGDYELRILFHNGAGYYEILMHFSRRSNAKAYEDDIHDSLVHLKDRTDIFGEDARWYWIPAGKNMGVRIRLDEIVLMGVN